MLSRAPADSPPWRHPHRHRFVRARGPTGAGRYDLRCIRGLLRPETNPRVVCAPLAGRGCSPVLQGADRLAREGAVFRRGERASTYPRWVGRLSCNVPSKLGTTTQRAVSWPTTAQGFARYERAGCAAHQSPCKPGDLAELRRDRAASKASEQCPRIHLRGNDEVFHRFPGRTACSLQRQRHDPHGWQRLRRAPSLQSARQVPYVPASLGQAGAR